MSSSNEAEDEEQPQLTSIVIITLPPSDNPSLGKTITAYTLSNPSNQPPSLPLPVQPNRTRHPILTLSVIFLFALLTFAYLQSSQSPITLTTSFGSSSTEADHNQNNDDEDEKKVNAFVFPLYPKLGFGEMYKMRDMEVKLGKFMMFGGKSSVLPVVDNDGGLMMSGKVVSGGNSVVLPVNGDDLRDGNYLAEVSRVTYGSKQLGLDRHRKGNGRIVFDSGSSYTYFTGQAYSDLVTMLKDVSRDGFIQDVSDTTLPICWKSKTPIRSIKDVGKFFKSLTFQFGRKWWTIPTYLQIPPEGYLIISNKGNVCLGILDGSDLLDGSHIIFGDISMRGNLIVYDNVKQKIGWMSSECINPKQSNNYLPFL